MHGMFARLFAGVSPEPFGGILLIPLGLWLFPIGVFLLAVGFGAEKSEAMETFSGYRYGTVLRWWNKRFARGLMSGLQKAVLFLAVAWLAAGTGVSVEEAVKISVLWLLHMASLDALFLLLNLVFAKRFVPAALLLLEGVTFLLGDRFPAVSPAMYGMWGMYVRSGWYETGGFPAGLVIAAELLLTAASYLAGLIYLRERGMEGI